MSNKDYKLDILKKQYEHYEVTDMFDILSGIIESNKWDTMSKIGLMDSAMLTKQLNAIFV